MMNNSTFMQALPVPRKVKKKQVKNELDRIKHAEKKKRRLEKALATSAAIRAELEKKKQKKKEGQLELGEEEEAKRQHQKDEVDRINQAEKKKMRLEKALATSAAMRAELEKKRQKRLEEQQRLDEEGAAIAEAVALHVLLGEDSNDPCQIVLNEEKGFNPWDCATYADFSVGRRAECVPYQACGNYAVQGIGFLSNAYGLGNSNWSLPYEPFGRDAYEPYSEGGWGHMGLSADLIAAQAVASLQISENAEVDAIVFNGMLSG